MKTELVRNGSSKPIEINREKLQRLSRLLGSWRSQTKNRRVECRRHHLKNDVLARFSREELLAALAWAVIGRRDVPSHFESACLTVEESLEGRDLLNVIYDFDRLEDYIALGIWITPKSGRGKIEGDADENAPGDLQAA